MVGPCWRLWWGTALALLVLSGTLPGCRAVTDWLVPPAPTAPAGHPAAPRKEAPSPAPRPEKPPPATPAPSPAAAPSVKPPSPEPAPSRAAAAEPGSAEVLERVATEQRLVALTLDLGETATRPATQAIVDYLAKHQIRCTFFVTGWFIRTYPDLLAQIVEQGHDLGNHTDKHPHCTRISSERLRQELTTVEQLLADKSLAISTPKYWRPPYGEYNREVVKTAAVLGYRAVMWSATSVDYNPIGNAEKEAQRILRQTGPGSIILCHTGPVSKEVIPRVVGPLLEKGYRFTTLRGLVEEGTGKG